MRFLTGAVIGLSMFSQFGPIGLITAIPLALMMDKAAERIRKK